jgi:hypothetical protein
MSIKEILEELPKLIPQEREAVLDWLVRDRLGANEFPESDEVVNGSDDTFQELVEKRIPIVIETVADYFPAELLDSYRGNDTVVFGWWVFRRTVARPC